MTFDERIQAGYDDYLEQYSIAKKMNRLNYLNSDIYTNKDLDLYGRFVQTIK